MFKKRKVQIGFFVLLVVLLILGITAIFRPGNKSSVKTHTGEATIRPTQMQPIIESGVVRPVHSQSIQIPEGSQINLFLNSGSGVSSGDVIGTATDNDTLNQGKKQLQKLETKIANAQVAGKSTTSLVAEREDIQNKINNATKNIVAPYAGTLSIDDTDTNNVKVKIASVEKYIASTVTDFDYDNLNVGDKVETSADANDFKTNEKITYISDIGEESGKVASYKFTTTASQEYRIGQQVSLKIKQNNVIIPKSAVQKDGDKNVIYIVKGGRAIQQSIKATRSGVNYIVSKDDLGINVELVKDPGNRNLNGRKFKG